MFYSKKKQPNRELGEYNEKSIVPEDWLTLGLAAGTITALSFPISGAPKLVFPCADLGGRPDGTFLVSHHENEKRGRIARCPYGDPGDVIWLRERWAQGSVDGRVWHYLAGGRSPEIDADIKWMRRQTMPRWAARIVLTVHERRVHRLHELTEAEATAHGFAATDKLSALDGFQREWNKEHPTDRWENNPWVWRLDVHLGWPESSGPRPQAERART